MEGKTGMCLIYIFFLIVQRIVRSTKGTARLQTGGHIINNIRFVGDTDVIAENGSGLKTLHNTIVKESENMGLSFKKKKSRQKVIPSYRLKVGTYDLRHVENFKYLGAMIKQNGKCSTEIKTKKNKLNRPLRK